MGQSTAVAVCPAGTLARMAKQKAETPDDGAPVLKRYFVKLSDEDKRRLDFLAVDARAESTELFGGTLLAAAIAEAWAKFDPKRKR